MLSVVGRLGCRQDDWLDSLMGRCMVSSSKDSQSTVSPLPQRWKLSHIRRRSQRRQLEACLLTALARSWQQCWLSCHSTLQNSDSMDSFQSTSKSSNFHHSLSFSQALPKELARAATPPLRMRKMRSKLLKSNRGTYSFSWKHESGLIVKVKWQRAFGSDIFGRVQPNGIASRSIWLLLWKLYGLRPAPAMPEFYSGLRGEGRKRLPDPSFMRPIWTVLGSCWRIDARNALPSGQRGRITVPAKHFFSETLLLPSTGIAKMPLNVYVGPSWGYVGPSVGSMLGPCSPMLDRRVPPEVFLGYVVFMASPSFPKFCLKKLSPVACEAPAPFLQHHFFEKAESCWGRAHPRWAPEGSHQWPARFQETLLEGRKRVRRRRAASR